jgi:hypothetical protein
VFWISSIIFIFEKNFQIQNPTKQIQTQMDTLKPRKIEKKKVRNRKKKIERRNRPVGRSSTELAQLGSPSGAYRFELSSWESSSTSGSGKLLGVTSQSLDAPRFAPPLSADYKNAPLLTMKP